MAGLPPGQIFMPPVRRFEGHPEFGVKGPQGPQELNQRPFATLRCNETVKLPLTRRANTPPSGGAFPVFAFVMPPRVMAICERMGLLSYFL